ncbi:nicotinate-nucleotide--dimethylbenzimidazole phosphoribosyltransferase [Methylorubrum extorquens]|uniref:Nicotinate-nucleotide--dimethylbenzimidazole phosphoribosyltransferase n=1 Tax=Methylorubrum extorquens TaxID=408 RepID=A0AAX3WKD6_METEX|nr:MULTISPECIES: nicotinate-nucleotide--dimethylbenzimidazole phosphoribosyltransferase [Methylobacteriaceae]KQP00088.1 nicotinate-nucleotide--dimethylbenzimidazole phosphoribosyltransferase [Methylobacterium sp. Leaf92]KQQ01053.1 nicotinate-nucleotide--dimethylbenzimidazole phosphoribosyltransferase [Methylobacterium sp. Leaf122]WHQ70878.1 nicotinate-nucleotide--dimethylbenzimidazole phosphoribosyltransferase [Methylorubrum extorquens]
MTSSPTPDASPFADIRRLLTEMPGPDGDAVAAIRARDASLTKPPGALGRLEAFVEWLGAWQGKAKPTLDRPMVCVFAGSHGVVERGVSAFPAAVNRQMLDNFAAGGAAINQLCAAYGLGFRVFDLAVDLPTGDICSGPALDEKGCVATMAFGMEAVAAGTDCLAVGEMGIGNTTVAAAIYAALYGGEAEHWVGRGTGLDAAGLDRKAEAVRLALDTHKDHLGDPLTILARLGGREIAAMAGAILAARLQRVPVVLDGYVATAAAAILHAADPQALDHCIAGHLSAEGAHGEVLERLGLKPVLSLDMRLGEASGAALALGLLKGALACHRDMATFEQAGVSGKSAD